MRLLWLLLLPTWSAARGGEQTRRPKSTPYNKHVLKGIVKVWCLDIQCKEESCLDLIWIFIQCDFSFFQKCFSEGCPFEGRYEVEHFWGPRLLIFQRSKNLQFSKPKSWHFFILQFKNFAKYESVKLLKRWAFHSITEWKQVWKLMNWNCWSPDSSTWWVFTLPENR